MYSGFRTTTFRKVRHFEVIGSWGVPEVEKYQCYHVPPRICNMMEDQPRDALRASRNLDRLDFAVEYTPTEEIIEKWGENPTCEIFMEILYQKAN